VYSLLVAGVAYIATWPQELTQPRTVCQVWSSAEQQIMKQFIGMKVKLEASAKLE